MKVPSFCLIFGILFPFLSLQAQDVKIEMKTDYGSIITELYLDKAPISCANFLKYIEHNKFDSLTFYRVVRMNNQPKNKVKIEVVQGGLGPEDFESIYPPIQHETTKETGILHKDGVISMARWGPGTATSEFFFCIGDQPALDFGGQRNPDGQGFAAFGKVVEGMDVLRKIQQLDDNSQMLIDQVPIHSVRILND